MNGDTGSSLLQTYTFVFTDIEGSTRLWEERPAEMSEALKSHDALLRGVFEGHGGHVFKTVGDAVHAAFDDPAAALTAAVDGQIALSGSEWCFFTVRMALHSGVPERTADDYFGPPLNRTARIRDAGWGGQILVSEATAGLLVDRMPQGCELRNLGQYRLKDLAEPYRIFQCLHPALGEDFPALRTLDVRKHNLPVQPTSFIGREREVDELRALLTDGVRCVTILGMGGCGKTRLSVQVGAELLDEFADGVWFIPLAPIADPDLIVSELAQVLNVKELQGATMPDSVCEYLRDKAALIVFDNFEHVLDGAPLISKILQCAPKVRVLATSREPLRVSGEQEWVIPVLADEYHTELFIDRARLVKPSFAPSEDERAVISQICCQLDGLPLAIELAAARVRMLTPAQIRARLADRLKLLTGGRRDTVVHHQTLRATIDWSYNLLSEDEQLLLAQLSVFSGWFDLDAAEVVCEGAGDVFDGLCGLREKSLLGSDSEGETIRFAMLQILREYAAERLAERGDGEGLRRRHAEYYTSLVEAQKEDLRGAAMADALNRMARDIDNFRASLDWAQRSGADDLFVRQTLELVQFWILRGLCTEALGRVERAIEVAAHLSSPASRGLLLNARASVLLHRGLYAQAGQAYIEAVEVNRDVNDPRALADSLRGAGWHASREGRRDEAYGLISEALELSRSAGDKYRMAHSLCDLGERAYHDGDYPEARRMFEEALGLARELGDRRAQSIHLQWLADVADIEGDLGRARTFTLEALEIERTLGNLRGVAWCLDQLSILALTASDFAEAMRLSEEALAIHREIDNQVGIAESLCRLAQVERMRGSYNQARAYAEEALAVDTALDDKGGIATEEAELGRIALAVGDLDEAARRLRAARDLYEQIDQKKELAEVLCCLAKLALHKDDVETARDLANQALAINRELGAKRGLLENLATLGRLAVRDGDPDGARPPFLEALDLAEELGDRTALAHLADSISELSAAEGRHPEAVALHSYADRVREDIGALLSPIEAEKRAATLAALGAVGDHEADAVKGSDLTIEQIRQALHPPPL
jgi:predicted ATPase/class 3 adenylate cyclase